MIKEIIMYTVICDGCGADVNAGRDIAAWNDKKFVSDIAFDSDWKQIDGKDYCPECYVIDDDDRVILTVD